MNMRSILFVRNEGAATAAAPPEPKTTKAIQNLTCNLLPNLVRHDQMEGRDYIVVPMVILTEGVHKGSEGPLYYPPDELSKTPVVWNHKPVVVYHPEINGQGVSACDPAILTSRKIGIMMNTRFEKGKLKSEAWIEKDRANKVDDRIMAAVENNEMMELSTGVFVDAEMTEGKWKDESYIGLARNYRPDHLAILPDKIGACSIADGAGFLRNEAKQGKGHIQKMFRSFLSSLGVVDNEMSFNNINSALCQALRSKLGVEDKMDYSGPYPWVADVYSNFFIYEYDGKLWRLGYTSSDTGVTLSEDKPVLVQRVTEYRTVEGAKFVGNQDQNADTDMNKKQLVDAIILAAATLADSWSEADREALMAMNDEQVKLIHNKVGKAKQEKAEPKTEPKTEPAAPAANAQAAATTTASPTAAKVISVAEYIAAAPREVQAVLNHSVEVYNEEKTRLVDAILAVKNNRFQKEDLSNRPISELRGLAALAGIGAAAATSGAPNYAGQGHVPPTDNTQVEEVLAAPVMNFDKK